MVNLQVLVEPSSARADCRMFSPEISENAFTISVQRDLEGRPR
jgi:hypothetical protein